MQPRDIHQKNNTELHIHFLILPACPNELEAKIMANLKQAAFKRAKRRLEAYGLTLVAVAGAAIPLTELIVTGFERSTFYQYFSLLGSDTGVLLSDWKETVPLFLESAPIVDIVLACGLVGLILYLVSKTTREFSLFIKPSLT